MLVLAGL